MILNVAVTQDGSPFDLTGCQLFFTAKLAAADLDADAKLSLSEADAIDIPDPAAGLARLIVPASLTASLDPGPLYYDFQLVSDTGFVFTVASGILTILPDITRRTA